MGSNHRLWRRLGPFAFICGSFASFARNPSPNPAHRTHAQTPYATSPTTISATKIATTPDRDRTGRVKSSGGIPYIGASGASGGGVIGAMP